MMRIQRRLPALAIAVALTSFVAACSAPANVAEPAKAGTGSLNIACSQQEDFCQQITAAFEKASGIDTSYVRLGSGEVLARLETTPGEFDVWSGGQAENHLLADGRGFVESYVSPSAKGLRAEYNDVSGKWSGFYTDSVGFCSNKAELDKKGLSAPTAWEDLLDPKLKGAVSMSHPATAGVGYMGMFTMKTLKNGDVDATIDYFKKLHSNVLQYSKSAATGTELAGRGEVAVAIALDSDCVKASKAGYADLVTTYPKEGTGYEVGAVSLLKNARNIDAGQAYMDWILSTDAQNLYKDVPSYAAPTHPDAVQGEDVPNQDDVKKVEWDLLKAAESRGDLIARFESDVAPSSTAK